MDWVKRNLILLVGSLVALIAMGAAGYYLYSKWQLNTEAGTKLDEVYAELSRLNRENPHPGDKKVNNVQAAKDQQEQMKAFLAKAREHFKRIPAIPDSTNVTSQEYANMLRRTIDQLQKQATNESVILPPNYSFSFEAQKPKMTFAAGSLVPLSVQLGEVQALCSILFQAKINSLDNLRRERVSTDDSVGPQTDYLEKKSVTNELAVMTPYEVSFRCFSTELASLLGGLASSPYGFIVKTINVESTTSATLTDPSLAAGGVAGGQAPYVYPGPTGVPGGLPAAEAGEAAMFARRYGLGGGRGRGGPGGPGAVAPGGVALRPMGTPAAPVYTAPAPGAPAGQPAARGGLPTVLDEKQVKVTLTLDIVKLLPPK